MKLIKRFAYACTILLTTMSGYAQNSILWEVSGNGLSTPSYIAGTLKFMGEQEYEMPAVLVEKIKLCELFAIEDQVDHHAQHELNKAIHLPKGQTLATLLPKEDYAKVQSFFATEFGISKKEFDKKYAKLIPLALSITMTRLSLKEDLRFYDIELLKKAKQHGLETYSLEEIDREAKAIHSFPMDAQISALMHSVDNFAKQKQEYQNLEAAYIRGDLDEVFEYTLHPFENNEKFIEEFYHQRNLEWMPKLEKMLSDQKAFVAVGVTHLKGEKGLLELLRAKGYTVNPVAMTE